MKKILTIIAMSLALVGCGNSATTTEIDVTATVEAMVDATSLTAELIPMTGSNVEELLYTAYDGEAVSEYVVYANASGSTAEEIAIFKAVDNDSAQTVKSMVETRVADQLNTFRDYNPNEITKLESPYIAVEGNYVVLVIAEDTSPAAKAFDDAF